MSAKPEPLAIIGPGKVGTALGALAARAGWPVAAIGGRDPARTAKAAERVSHGCRPCSLAEAAGAGKIVLLTVSDQAIETVCRELAAAGAFRRGSVVAHCCGALDSGVLSAAKDKCGCLIASCHPFQTFPTVEAAIERLSGAQFYCEGDSEAVKALVGLVSAIGGKAVPMAGGKDAKALYHAGAVMACNYLTALMDAALELMAQAGVERETALAALARLAAATVENVAALGPEAALTGPIARGDVDTVRRHLEAIVRAAGLPGRADLEAFYRAAGLWTVELAARKGTIDPSARQALRKCLASKPKER